jgi:hypothetical protein
MTTDMSQDVKIPQMPQGVEHTPTREQVIDRLLHVKIPQMPQGVEHSSYPSAIHAGYNRLFPSRLINRPL